MWRARPVFVSSTFADMQSERDYLRTHVFPELEEALHGRRLYLEWVDLRVGIATASESDAASRQLQVLKVCFAEVRRCRPFLIALIGDRYGTVMPLDRVSGAALEEGFSGDVSGRSITDLEIEFGVLADPDQQTRSFFYFREPLPYTEMPAELAPRYSDAHPAGAEAPDAVRRLVELKARIKSRLPTHVRAYSADWDRERNRVVGLESFGRMVAEDLLSAFEAEIGTTVSEADPPWQTTEREAQADFIDDRAWNFIGRLAELDRLSDLATAVGRPDAIWGACVIGDPGSGKSALFGALCRQLSRTDVFVLAHAAGASPRAASIDTMLRRWISELRVVLGREVDPPETLPEGPPEHAEDDAVDAAFAGLLALLAQRRRVVLLIDALDQFEPTARARFATWLPRPWPANARLITTSIRNQASIALAARSGFVMALLPPLAAVEARGIAEAICARYHRTFEPDVIEALLARQKPDGPAWGNPLWLVLAVEELNLLDADDFDDARGYPGTDAEQLRELMLEHIASFPATIPGLYAHTFARAEKLFGASVTRGFLGLIAVSRAGWRELDFRILLPRVSGKPWDELAFAQLRRFFRGQIRQRGELALWHFNHAQMRAAVQSAVDGNPERSLHRQIADHLLTCPADDAMHVRETMYHLVAAEDYLRAADYYGRPSLNNAEIIWATVTLRDAVASPLAGTPEQAARLVCRLVERTDASSAMVARRFVDDLRHAIRQNASIEVRLILFNAAKDAFERTLQTKAGDAGLLSYLATTNVLIGDLLFTLGRLAASLEAYRGALSIDERLVGADLSGLYNKLGDVLFQQNALPEALDAYRRALTLREERARRSPHDAGLQHDLSFSYNKVGDVLSRQGSPGGAQRLFSTAAEIRQRLVKSDPDNDAWQSDLATSYVKVGEQSQNQGGHSHARKCYGDALAISEKLIARNPADAGRRFAHGLIHQKIAGVEFTEGHQAAAFQHQDIALNVIGGLVHSDPDNSLWQSELARCHIGRGDVDMTRGDLAGARQSFDEALQIRRRLAESESANGPWRRDLAEAIGRIGDLLTAQNDFSGALESHRESLAIIETLQREDGSNSEWQQLVWSKKAKIGAVLQDTGDLEQALRVTREALDVADRIARARPEDAGWRQNLANSDVLVAGVLLKMGKPGDAIEQLRHEVTIWEQLTGSDQANVEWQDRLGGSYALMADTLTTLGEPRAALDLCRKSLAIYERLALSDSANGNWQRNLVMMLRQIGDLEMRQDHVAAALTSFAEGHARAEQAADALLARGEPAAALNMLQRACTLLVTLAKAQPDDAGHRRALAACYDKTGDVLLTHGEPRVAEEAFTRGLAIKDELSGESRSETTRRGLRFWRSRVPTHTHPEDIVSRRDRAVSLGKIGGARDLQGDHAGALEFFRDALAALERITGEPDLEARFEMAGLHERIGDLLQRQGDMESALKSYEASRAVCTELGRARPDNPRWTLRCSQAHRRLGDFFLGQAKPSDALTCFQGGVAALNAAVKADPDNVELQRALSGCQEGVGIALKRMGRLPDALGALRDSVNTSRRVATAHPRDGLLQYSLSVAVQNVGDTQVQQRDYDGAAECYDECATIRRDLSRSNPDRRSFQIGLSRIYDRMARVSGMANRPAEARKWALEKLPIDERLAKASPNDRELQRNLALAYQLVAISSAQSQDATNARAAVENGLSILSKLTDYPSPTQWREDMTIFDRIISQIAGP